MSIPDTKCVICASMGTACGYCEASRDATKATNPKDAVATNRLDLSLVPSSAVAYIALALTEGEAKYGGYNWRVAGVRASVYVAACKRHLAKWFDGEECDPVSKVPHLANALACLAVLVDSKEAGNLKDDRPPPAETGALLSWAEGVVKHLRALYPDGPGRYRAKP